MLSIIKSLSLTGIESQIINVEVNVAKGLPQFTIIGLPDKAVQESRERVLTTLHELGYKLPLKKIVVNLAPADLKKDGGKFDLPIAIGILCASGLIENLLHKNVIILGEISLSGEIKRVKGILAMLINASKKNYNSFT